MKRFLYISPVSDFDTTTESDFISEFLTTLTPFEIVTDNEVPETDINEIDGLQMMIYGIGGLLIFLLVWTFCYYCFMPPISDARSDTIIRRNAESLRARARAAAIANINALEETEEVTSTNTVPNQVSESCQISHRNSDSLRPVEGQGTRILNGAPQTEGRFFPQRLQNLFRPNTMAKQVRESQHVTNRRYGSHGATISEQCDSRYFSPQQNEETELASGSFRNTLVPETEPKDLSPSNTDPKPYEEDSTEDSSSTDRTEQLPPVVERLSQSSPTSPDVRRRFSSIKDTPRLSSSWR